VERGSESNHARRILSAMQGQEAAKSYVAASWRRSMMLHRLDPMLRSAPRTLTGHELHEMQQRNEHLIAIAGPSLDHLFQVVSSLGGCVLLTNAQGVPIVARNPVADEATFRRWGLCEGAVWSEEAEGTNGIGTCIAEQRAITIHRDQHYLARNAGLSCIDAPIFNHEGKLIGALDVSSPRSDLTEPLLGLIATTVNDTARKIEIAHFRAHFHHARIALAPVMDQRGGAALLAIDKDDLVIGATRAARQLLGLTAERLSRPLPAADLWGEAAGESTALQDAERAALARALARHQGNVTAAAAALGMSRATLHRKLKRLKDH
jgi:transcriptional regulator of acetoin/glycerol metabolism